MVGALWIDSGSDSDGDVARSSRRRHRRSQDLNAVAGSSRLDIEPLRRSPRRAAAPPRSPSSVIALSSSQDHDQHSTTETGHSRAAGAFKNNDSHQATADRPTHGQRTVQLLAEPSPDTPLPSFRDILQQHRSRSFSSITTRRGLDPSITEKSIAFKARVAPASSRTGSLRRTASQPTVTSSQEGPTSSLSVRRPTKKMTEVIEIGSDSIIDESDAPLLQTSSPIRSQFSARQHQLSSSQPLALSPPRRSAATTKDAVREIRGSGRQTSRAESAPILILSSSPPPASLPGASQSSIRGNGLEDVAEEDFEMPDFPPSSFPFDDPPPSPPFSPVGQTADTSPSPKKRAAEPETALLWPKRVKELTRSTSLLDALDKLYDAEGTAMPTQPPDRNASVAGASDQATTTAGSDDAPRTKASSSKADKAAAAKQAREAKAGEREAAKAAKLLAATEKKRILEANRLRTSKSDTMRELIVDLDRMLFTSGSPLSGCEGSVKARFEEEGAAVHMCDGVVAPPMIRFRRKVKAEWDAERRYWKPLDREEVRRETVSIVYVDAKDVVRVVQEDTGNQGGLERWYGDLKRRLKVLNVGAKGDEQVFLICQGLVKYYNRIRKSENRAYTARIRQQLAENQPAADAAADDDEVSEMIPKVASRRKGAETVVDPVPATDIPPQAMVERALLQLKLIHRCYVIHAASLVDGVEWLHQLTSDLSLKPYKSLRDTHLSFAVHTGRNTTSSSSAAIYTMMLQQIPRVTPSIAKSITTIYPSLSALVKAYKRCKDEKEEKGLLSGVQVQSNKDGTVRRDNRMNLGLQLSKRIRAVIRGTDGEVVVNNPTKD
ncbi:uncharacterized protein MEPE_03410 [Melanopsichium pennsylvanicum]|uniref:ERCC4 domain-containing protein n=2 Tax=Melanopsichium pennsylvanicum TaxID=63383 RepID=A0AAJ4XMV4_9BASI|nr:vesicle membrane protein (v-snare) with acyltransferase ykt6p [Melanopsichium pennsylvanicum 4]SNX84701.1 uncharacterized protein MEPE_03410 [Melanopsichium pennsylvanicum]